MDAAAAGRPAGALDALLRTRVPPGQRRWQPDFALLMALAGALQRDLEVDAPLGLDSHGGIKIIDVEEAKWSASGAPLPACLLAEPSARPSLPSAGRLVRAARVHSSGGRPAD